MITRRLEEGSKSGINGGGNGSSNGSRNGSSNVKDRIQSITSSTMATCDDYSVDEMRPTKFVVGVDSTRCAGAQISAVVNGVVKAPFMQTTPPIVSVRFTAVALPIKICIRLRPPCPTITDLCYGTAACNVALLDAYAGDGCCVIDTPVIV